MKILVCGDFVAKKRGIEQVETKKALSPEVCSIVKDHEISIVNFEAPVADPTTINGIIKDGPHLCTNESTLQYLAECGFKCVTLANNHFLDYGEKGAKCTFDGIKKYLDAKIGAGTSIEEQKEPLTIEEAKIKIFNYCESESSVDNNIGSNKLDPVKAFYDITTAKNKGYVVIVITHGGHEGYQLPSPRMVDLYRYFIDCGANVVINHHQHCFSGYEKYHDGMIFYGLGNFFFDSFFKNGYIPNGWNEGYMVSLDIRNGILKNFDIIPYIQCKGDDATTRLLTNEEKQIFNNKIKEFNLTIQNPEKLKDCFDEFAKTKTAFVMRVLSPYNNKWVMKFYNHHLLPYSISQQKAALILNLIRCESLRDVCMNALKSIVNGK